MGFWAAGRDGDGDVNAKEEDIRPRDGGGDEKGGEWMGGGGEENSGGDIPSPKRGMIVVYLLYFKICYFFNYFHRIY